MPITSACQIKYASSNHIGFLNADATRAGKLCGAAVPVGLEASCASPPAKPDVGCEAPDGAEIEEAAEEGEADEVAPPAVEPPPPFEVPPGVFVLPECRAFGQEEEEEDGEEERSSVGRSPAGTASESRDTSPRMCSTYWAGTPDWLTGWVNTTCSPVALTVSPPEPAVPVPVPAPSPVVVGVVVVPVSVPEVVVVVVPVVWVHGVVVVGVVSVGPQKLDVLFVSVGPLEFVEVVVVVFDGVVPSVVTGRALEVVVLFVSA